MTDLTLLDRRPIVIKVENLPREHRPQYGLSLADLVYEYYTEQGGTRFAAVFYGQDANKVGPIRSGRFFDVNVVQMYRGIFIFGSAYSAVWNRFVNSDFADRLVLENDFSCPALCRFEPNGRDLLVANTTEMAKYVKTRAVDNSRQVLDGMFFQQQPPANGDLANQVYVRYSGAIYNRWDYDPASGRYLRFEDTQNDIDRKNEVYAQLTDQLMANRSPRIMWSRSASRTNTISSLTRLRWWICSCSRAAAPMWPAMAKLIPPAAARPGWPAMAICTR